MKTILCVEDDVTILHNNRKNLTDSGYRVLTAETVAEARERLSEQTPDIIVLDIMLPDGNGLDFLKELRIGGCTLPIIMLTAWNRGEHIAHGLESGADDYIGKPFEYNVLLARIKKALANAERIPETITRGTLTLNLTPMTAFIGGEDMKLKPMEYKLLLFFVQNEGKAISAETIYEKVWGQPMGRDTNAFRKVITCLRQKIEPAGYTVTNVFGKGQYIFESL